MSTFVPRQFYSQEEIEKLYPKELELQLVQIPSSNDLLQLLRHGERTPVSPRFQNTGLHPYWPYCNHVQRLTSVILQDKGWDNLQYRRRLETFGADDGPVFVSGPQGEVDSMCLPGELTDKGRETTLALGQRLRHLYIDQLRFMPKLISDSDMIYIRATPIQRAFESVQQAFTGFYPPSARTADFPTPTIIQRASADETLYPNEGACRRFAVLSRAFAQRAAERWNDTEDMQYLSKKISKYMPGGAKVAVDSHPRLSGIMDTLNATDAHGPATKLPKEFYDPKVRAITDKIAVEEWNAGYTESLEYRMLGVGGLMGDIASRMTGSAQRNDHDGVLEVGGQGGKTGQGRRGKTDLKLALSGCHDTTLSGVLTSLGAFDGEKWPPFTSHIAFEMFRKRSAVVDPAPVVPSTQGWWSSTFTSKPTTEPTPESISRTPTTQVSASQKSDLTDYYVRIRYNDKIMQVPGCKAAGKHLDGDTTFCTLEAFKSIVDKYTPKNWKAACAVSKDEPAFPAQIERAGF